MSSKVYNVPSWSSIDLNEIAQQEYSIEVLKDGVIVDRINLNNVSKSYYILGRQPDIVDIQMDHPSISRQHAILQFRNDNNLMIMDWQSAQGTFVNKIQLEKDLYQRLYVGDIIKFGCSTRMYILNGPDDQSREEYDSIGMQQYRQKLTDHSNKIKEKLIETSSISWGFTEDAPPEDDDYEDDKHAKEKDLPSYIKNDKNYDRKYADKYSVELDESEVNEKDKQLLEKIKTKERKIQNLQEENKRIYMKENQDGGLSENQLKTVSRNDDRINELMENIEVLVAQIKDKNLQRQKQTEVTKTKEDKFENDDNDNDNIRDTTNETADQGTNWRLRKKLAKTSTGHSSIMGVQKDSYSYDDLCNEKKSLESLLHDLQNQIDNMNSIIINNNSNDNETDIEVYIKQSNINEAIAKLKVLEASHNDTIRKLKSVESLVKIAAPALPSLMKQVNKEATVQSTTSLTPIIESNIDIDKGNDIESSNNNNSNTKGPVNIQSTKKEKANYAMQSLSSLIEFIEAEKRGKQNDEEPTKRPRDSVTEEHEPQKKIKGPIVRPQEFVEEAARSEKQIDNNSNSNSNNESLEITWKPPKNQDGSGKTKLNDLLGY